MKRLRVDETAIKEGSGSSCSTAASSALYSNSNSSSGGVSQSLPPNTASTLAYSAGGAVGGVKVVSEGMQSGLYPPAPVSYSAMPTATAPHSTNKGPTAAAMQPLSVGGGGGHSQLRAAGASPPSAASVQQQQQELQQQQQQQQQQPQAQPQQQPALPPPQQQSPGSAFQRLKVEDALTYLDQVKFKFGSKPQVYNDFLDIMKEFKSQSIDTPGVIQRVSNLFKGFPELISGFNTFLPPGYKIEVQRSDQGYAFQVSVSMPSPTGTMQSDAQPQKMIMRGSGVVNMSGGGGSSVPLSSLSTAQCQPLSLTQQQQHVQPTSVAPPSAPSSIPVVHHSSVYAGSGSGTASTTYNNSLVLSAAHVAVSLQGHTDNAPSNQPVQFNHAINYVNKIKNRFQDQPEKYKRFLDILHIYQKEQRTIKEASTGGPGIKHLTEQEVYSQVAKLFANQDDLLTEFGQFLPDATSHINNPAAASMGGDHSVVPKRPPTKPPAFKEHHTMDRHMTHKPGHVSGHQLKRSPTFPAMMHRDAPPAKKHKMSSCRDVTLAEAGKYGNLHDYAFFDKVRKAVRTQEVYNNFLRCLTLFNQEIISKSELLLVVNPFLGKFPELMRWFREFLGQNETEQVPYNVTKLQGPQGEAALEIDLTTAKRLGASYCVIPPAQEGLTCSGRTQLCKEVLNDQWVSFPTWSEDSTFVSSRKTQYEEYMYRCEDERFELDVVIETNASTIRVLETVSKKLTRMSPEDAAKYKLDDCLGGSTEHLHQRAIKRIYGDKAQEIIDGLKRNPSAAVPVVLRRLRHKEEEWRDAQKGFNKIWREQNEKYYLKSLDHQGINFKQTDIKALRSKSLFNEIETLFDERHEQNEEGADPVLGPHIVLPYKDRTILDDAANLLIHHVKRQTGIQKGEKRRIKHLLRQFVPELFFHPKQQLTDDEREDEDEKDDDGESPSSSPNANKHRGKSDDASPGKSPGRSDGDIEMKTETDAKEEDVKVPFHAQSTDPDEAYTLYMASNNWYIFLRLHAILCERLAKIYERSVLLAAEEAKVKKDRPDSTALALRLKPKPQIDVEDYYVAFLDMVKNLLDGNMEATTYEDTLREMFGIHAYIAFTLDKVVSYAVRQLQHCVTERTAIACTDLYAKEQKRGATGGLCTSAHKRVHLELAYQRASEKAVQDENCFKIYVYKKDCRMTIELLDTDSEDPKKVDDAKKWNAYKECYSDCRNADNKLRSPVYLNRNLRMLKKRHHKLLEKKNSLANSSKDESGDEGDKDKRDDSDECNRGPSTSDKDENGSSSSKYNILEELERKLNEKSLPDRNQSEHLGYDVSDETQCKISQDSKLMFALNKDSYFYRTSAFAKAIRSHPEVTKRLSSKFRAWLKRWANANVSDSQYKQCIDWLMGRGDGVVPNRTRVLTDNDLSRTPYVSYNRYHVERLNDDST